MKFLLMCTCSGADTDENAVWANHWKVGEYDNLQDCYDNAIDDYKTTLEDSYENFDDEELANELVEAGLNTFETYQKDDNEICLYEPICIADAEYSVNEYNTTLLNYIIVKVQ